ncbi:MAG TPA: hypothetical protein O0X39_05740 [Methanocorpusculum sp.]|nr:hypothetical protein [Methanocorpusculum sp.]
MSRKPDEIMAEYLLNGAKMLSETCKKCGAPLFEVKGKKLCVVCAENEAAAEKAASAPKAVPASENIRVIVPEYAKESTADQAAQTELACTLDALISEFCERAHKESDAGVCLTLMECVRTAAEAKMMLNRK